MLVLVATAIACTPNITTPQANLFCNGGAANLYNEDDRRSILDNTPCTDPRSDVTGSATFRSGNATRTLLLGMGGFCACGYNQSHPDPLIRRRTQMISCDGYDSSDSDNPWHGSPDMDRIIALLRRTLEGQPLAPACPAARPLCAGFFASATLGGDRVTIPGVCVPENGMATGETTPFLYPAAQSRAREVNDVGPQPCDCHSAVPEWGPVDDDTAINENTYSRTDVARGACKAVKLGWGWSRQSSRIDSRILTIPPGPEVPVKTVMKSLTPTDPTTGQVAAADDRNALPCGPTYHHPPSAITLKDFCKVKPGGVNAMVQYGSAYDVEVAAAIYGLRNLCAADPGLFALIQSSGTSTASNHRRLLFEVIATELALGTRDKLTEHPPFWHGTEAFPSGLDVDRLDFHIGSPTFKDDIVDPDGSVSPFRLLFYHFSTAVIDYAMIVNNQEWMEDAYRPTGSHLGRAPRFNVRHRSGFDQRFLGDLPSVLNKLTLPGMVLDRESFDCHHPAKERACAAYHGGTEDRALSLLCETKDTITVEDGCYIRQHLRSKPVEKDPLFTRTADSEGTSNVVVNLTKATQPLTLQLLFSKVTDGDCMTGVKPCVNATNNTHRIHANGFSPTDEDCVGPMHAPAVDPALVDAICEVQWLFCDENASSNGKYVRQDDGTCMCLGAGTSACEGQVFERNALLYAQGTSWFDFILELPVFTKGAKVIEPLGDNACFYAALGFLPPGDISTFVNLDPLMRQRVNILYCAAFVDLLEQFHQIVKLTMPSVLTDAYWSELYGVVYQSTAQESCAAVFSDTSSDSLAVNSTWKVFAGNPEWNNDMWVAADNDEWERMCETTTAPVAAVFSSGDSGCPSFVETGDPIDVFRQDNDPCATLTVLPFGLTPTLVAPRMSQRRMSEAVALAAWPYINVPALQNGTECIRQVRAGAVPSVRDGTTHTCGNGVDVLTTDGETGTLCSDGTTISNPCAYLKGFTRADYEVGRADGVEDIDIVALGDRIDATREHYDRLRVILSGRETDEDAEQSEAPADPEINLDSLSADTALDRITLEPAVCEAWTRSTWDRTFMRFWYVVTDGDPAATADRCAKAVALGINLTAVMNRNGTAEVGDFADCRGPARATLDLQSPGLNLTVSEPRTMCICWGSIYSDTEQEVYRETSRYSSQRETWNSRHIEKACTVGDGASPGIAPAISELVQYGYTLNASAVAPFVRGWMIKEDLAYVMSGLADSNDHVHGAWAGFPLRSVLFGRSPIVAYDTGCDEHVSPGRHGPMLYAPGSHNFVDGSDRPWCMARNESWPDEIYVSADACWQNLEGAAMNERFWQGQRDFIRAEHEDWSPRAAGARPAAHSPAHPHSLMTNDGYVQLHLEEIDEVKVDGDAKRIPHYVGLSYDFEMSGSDPWLYRQNYPEVFTVDRRYPNKVRNCGCVRVNSGSSPFKRDHNIRRSDTAEHFEHLRNRIGADDYENFCDNVDISIAADPEGHVQATYNQYKRAWVMTDPNLYVELFGRDNWNLQLQLGARMSHNLYTSLERDVGGWRDTPYWKRCPYGQVATPLRFSKDEWIAPRCVDDPNPPAESPMLRRHVKPYVFYWDMARSGNLTLVGPDRIQKVHLRGVPTMFWGSMSYAGASLNVDYQHQDLFFSTGSSSDEQRARAPPGTLAQDGPFTSLSLRLSTAGARTIPFLWYDNVSDALYTCIDSTTGNKSQDCMSFADSFGFRQAAFPGFWEGQSNSPLVELGFSHYEAEMAFESEAAGTASCLPREMAGVATDRRSSLYSHNRCNNWLSRLPYRTDYGPNDHSVWRHATIGSKNRPVHFKLYTPVYLVAVAQSDTALRCEFSGDPTLDVASADACIVRLGLSVDDYFIFYGPSLPCRRVTCQLADRAAFPQLPTFKAEMGPQPRTSEHVGKESADSGNRKSYADLMGSNQLRAAVRLGHMAAGRAAPFALSAWMVDPAAGPVVSCAEMSNAYPNYNHRVMPDWQAGDSDQDAKQTAAYFANVVDCPNNTRCSPLNDNRVVNESGGYRYGSVPTMKRKVKGPMAWHVGLPTGPANFVSVDLFRNQAVWDALEDYSTLRADGHVGLFSASASHFFFEDHDTEWRPGLGERPPALRFNRFMSYRGIRKAAVLHATMNRALIYSPDPLTQSGMCFASHNHTADSEGQALYRRRHFASIDPLDDYVLLAARGIPLGLLPRHVGPHVETDGLNGYQRKGNPRENERTYGGNDGFNPNRAGHTAFVRQDVVEATRPPPAPVPAAPARCDRSSFEYDFLTVATLGWYEPDCPVPSPPPPRPWVGRIECPAGIDKRLGAYRKFQARTTASSAVFDGAHNPGDVHDALQAELNCVATYSKTEREQREACGGRLSRFGLIDVLKEAAASTGATKRCIDLPGYSFRAEGIGDLYKNILVDTTRQNADVFRCEMSDPLGMFSYGDRSSPAGSAATPALGGKAIVDDDLPTPWFGVCRDPLSDEPRDPSDCWEQSSKVVWNRTMPHLLFTPDEALLYRELRALAGGGASMKVGVSGATLLVTPRDEDEAPQTTLLKHPDWRYRDNNVFEAPATPDNIDYFTAATVSFPAAWRVITVTRHVEKRRWVDPTHPGPHHTATSISEHCRKLGDGQCTAHRGCDLADGGCRARDVPDCASDSRPCADAEFPVCLSIIRTDSEGMSLKEDGSMRMANTQQIASCIPIAHKKLLDRDTYPALFENATLWRPNCNFGQHRHHECSEVPESLAGTDSVAESTNFPDTSEWAALYKPYSFFGGSAKDHSVGVTPAEYIDSASDREPEEVASAVAKIEDFSSVDEGYLIADHGTGPGCGPGDTGCSFLVDYLSHVACPTNDAGTWHGTCIKPELQLMTPLDFANSGRTLYSGAFGAYGVPFRDEMCMVYEPDLQVVAPSERFRWPDNFVLNNESQTPSSTGVPIEPEPGRIEYVHYCDPVLGLYTNCDNDPTSMKDRENICEEESGGLVYTGLVLDAFAFKDICDVAEKSCRLFPGARTFGTLASIVAMIRKQSPPSGWTIEVMPFNATVLEGLLLAPMPFKVARTNDLSVRGCCGAECTTDELEDVNDHLITAQRLGSAAFEAAREICDEGVTMKNSTVEAIAGLSGQWDAYKVDNGWNVPTAKAGTYGSKFFVPEAAFTTRSAEAGTLLVDVDDLRILPYEGHTLILDHLRFRVAAAGFRLERTKFLTDEPGPVIEFSGATAGAAFISEVAADGAARDQVAVAFLGADTDFAQYAPAIDVSGVSLRNVTGNIIAAFARAVGVANIEVGDTDARCNEWANAYNQQGHWDGDVRWSVDEDGAVTGTAAGSTLVLRVENHVIYFFSDRLVDGTGRACVSAANTLVPCKAAPAWLHDEATGGLHVAGNPFFCLRAFNGTVVYGPCSPCSVGRGAFEPCEGRQMGNQTYTPAAHDCGGEPCTVCGLSGTLGRDSCSQPAGIDIIRCAPRPFGGIARYACGNKTGMVAVDGGVGGLYDCSQNTVVHPGYGYTTTNNVVTSRVVIQPEASVGDTTLVAQGVEVINVTQYTGVFGKPYQQQRYSRPVSAAGVSSVVAAVLLIVIGLEVVAHVGLQYHRELVLAALDSYRS